MTILTVLSGCKNILIILLTFHQTMTFCCDLHKKLTVTAAFIQKKAGVENNPYIDLLEVSCNRMMMGSIKAFALSLPPVKIPSFGVNVNPDQLHLE